ncbi:hypothetical protein OHA72_24605 [Dactylosporangium sp. NBC_01737]|uniref:hypothetical protein n=1 Tax=Dactylosporangium sp. NBC_01737 TaxID=2975959 RepID=UPI002E15CBBA|nr:hypothetical protein OHA72_24605 [Dactylosporangium sp. NBC_01737]
MLWAYPPRYRRAELLDTLLEAAAPGRRRPAVREAANLLRHGMRARLGRPASRGVVVVAWLSVVVFAFLGMAGAARLSWFTARSLPDAVELEAIRQTAYPGLRPVAQTRVDDVFYYDEPTTSRALLFGADDYTPGRVETLYGSGEDLRVLLPGVRDRLVADGWQVSEVEFWDESTYGTGADLYAQRDGLTIWATDGGWQATPRLDLTITRTRPAATVPLSVLGAVLGALVGWLVAGWVSRRTEGRHIALRGAVGTLATSAFVLIQPALLLCAVALYDPLDQPWMPVPVWFGFMYLGRFPAILALGAGLGVLALAAMPRRRPVPADLAVG